MGERSAFCDSTGVSPEALGNTHGLLSRLGSERSSSRTMEFIGTRRARPALVRGMVKTFVLKSTCSQVRLNSYARRSPVFNAIATTGQWASPISKRRRASSSSVR